MSKTLSDSDLEALRDLLDTVDYRLLISNGVPLPSLDGYPPQQLDLTAERDRITLIRELLGLPLKNQGDRSPD